MFKCAIISCICQLLKLFSLTSRVSTSAQIYAVTSQQKQASKAPEKSALLVRQSLGTFSSGAVLGPLCDAQHSRFHVLEYADPYTLEIPGLSYAIQTCW